MSSQEEYLDRLLKGLGADSLVQTNTVEKQEEKESDLERNEGEKPSKVFVDHSVSEEEDVVPETVEQTEDFPASFPVSDASQESVELQEENLIEPDMMVADIAELLQQTSDESEMDFQFHKVDADDAESANELDYLTEEDIEQMLRSAMEGSFAEVEAQENSVSQDLYELLQQDTGDSSKEIQELLQKDENDEVIDHDSIVSMDAHEADALEAAIYSEEETEQILKTADKSAKAALRREKKELRDSKRREQRDRKRQEKLAKKEAHATRTGKRKNKDVDLVPLTENPVFQVVEPGLGVQEQVSLDDMLDSLGAIDALNTGEAIDTIDMMDSIDALSAMDLVGVEDLDVAPEPLTEEELAADALFQELTGDSSVMDLFDMASETTAIPDIVTSIDTSSGAKNKKQPLQKKSIFNRFLDFLTEEDEEPEESKGNEDVSMSSENQNILKEMDAESGKKKKKKKKGQLVAEGENEEGEHDENKKAKKAKKNKKEKPPKAPKPEEPETPTPKLSKKKVLIVTFIGISACAIIVVIASILTEYTNKREARQAYYAQDYQTCYQNLFGKELNESEQVMFHRSEMILKIRLWIREYEILAAEGSELEALDSLIQSVYEYPGLLEYSNQWNAGSDVEAVYQELLTILDNRYHVSEEQALAIANIVSDVEYTRAVTAIVDGLTYEQWLEQRENTSEKKEENTPVSRLPEEDEIKVEIEFIDNV